MYNYYSTAKNEVKIKLPTIYMDALSFNKMKVYIETATGEISGLGFVRNVGIDFYVHDLILLDQSCTYATTDLDEQAVSDFFLECIENGVDVSELKLWWHSHAHMGTFWSGTDEDTISKLSDEWMLSIVANKSGDILGRLDIYKPLRVTFNELPVKIYYPIDEELREELKEEVHEKVKNTVTVYSYTKPSSGNVGIHVNNDDEMKEFTERFY